MTGNRTADGQLETNLPSVDSALPSALRFRVDDVYGIIGEGCVAVGEVEIGVVRPPVRVKIAQPGDASIDGKTVEIVRAFVKRKQQIQVIPGQPAGLTLRDVPTLPHLLPSKSGGPWALKKGSHLVAP